jgi:NADH-quinone oxidoreductase subunit L
MMGLAGHGDAGHGDHATKLFASKIWYNWITADTFTVNAGFWFDPLTAVMLCVVTGIGFFITVFAKGYMAGESGYFRFFAYLGLFLFAMTILVMGENLIMLYLGWEGVGLCSYLLIGYYYDKPSAREAAKKAFLVNRIGDFGFGLGIMLIFMAFGTVSYFGAGAGTGTGFIEMAAKPLTEMTPFQQTAMQWIPFLLMLGAFGKSAQFPLYVWLPDAMEGPTPVSALIHAATMVTAGVYMIARCSTVFVGHEAALALIAGIGGFTAIFAGSIALRQFDLKKVFAYSTVSQLGFMFVAVGVLAPVAGVFHLVTHAFFKALLFLSSGVVMHAMMGELDMRKMSGLKRVLPKTRLFMLVGCLALAGVFPLAGFWSKDEIVVAAFDRNVGLGLLLLITAFLTAYYTFRLYFRVFEGPEIIPPPPADAHGGHDSHGHGSHGHDSQGHGSHGHGDHGHHNHEPVTMMLPLFVLTIGALLAGALNLPFDLANIKAHSLGNFLGQSPSFVLGYEKAVQQFGEVNPLPMGHHSDEHHVHVQAMVISGLVALAGILLAYWLHLKDRRRAERIAAGLQPLTGLLEAKYYVDEIYQSAIVEPLRMLGNAFFLIDRMVVDGLVFVVGFIPQLSGFALKLTTQRGYLQGYALSMILGIAVILLVVFL